MDKKEKGTKMDRRGFLTRTAAAAGAGAILAGGLSNAVSETATTKARTGKTAELNIGIIGVGAQGHVLLTSCLKAGQSIPGLRFKAVCDIWKFNREKGVNTLNAYNKTKGYGAVKEYSDYKDMLAEKDALDLDAVIVATPDWLHAEHSIACMKEGLHVYCEKEMSNSLELAKDMVLTSRETKKLLQIGHQRRSNPRYLHAVKNCVLDSRLLGRVMQGYGQWNRAVSDDIGWPQKHALTAGELAKSGYDTMSRFRNWRWYKRYGGGPIVDLGSHQIDIFAWIFKSNPKSVVASGGIDYYKHHEWYDNVMCLFEYENDEGMARAFYQVQTTTRHGGFHEAFMGEHGTLVISEVPRDGNWLEKEINAPDWNKWVKKGYLKEMSTKMAKTKTSNVMLDVRVSPAPPKWPLPIELGTLPHQPHLHNFFDAVRINDRKSLNCPGEIGYETAVAVLAVNDAVKSQKKIEFTHDQFEV
ncbi:MAG: Gfo/Idh/MocA family oxidoreductase [Phycisphaerae bacterium]|jgi:predicted dehydrogenase|nr:Gfo/Idh/MocA family oxidoreductase [Phycisphaerae bacterium]